MESVQNACWRFTHFPQARRRSINKQQNRTFHLLQKPDIFICYRHEECVKPRQTQRLVRCGGCLGIDRGV
jgi:hypothetical protein